jgi:HKD family nuclease
MEVKFISNSLEPQAHDKQIVELIKSSDEVWMAVAFLKLGGLALIGDALQDCINANKKVHIVAGLYFGITDPAALTKLLEMLKGNRLYLARDGVKERNFHPKLYIFRSGKNYTIISGSANITNGGLTKNIECSLQVTAHEDESVCKDALKFIDDLINNNCDLATEPLIAQYEKDWLKQKENPKNSKWNKGFDDEEVNVEPEKERKYYRIMAGSDENNVYSASELAQMCFNGNFIGTDYGVIEDLTKEFNDTLFTKDKFIKKHITEFKKRRPKAQAKSALSKIWNVSKEFNDGDIIITPDKDGSYFVGVIDGPYYYADSFAAPPPLPHRRPVKWFKIFSRELMNIELKNVTKKRPLYMDITSFKDEIEMLIQNGEAVNSKK